MERGVMLGAPLLFTIELTILYAAGYYAMGRLVSISGFGGANGSVLIIMLFHTMNNTISGSFFSPMFSGADSVRQSWLLAAMWCAVAVVVVLRSGSSVAPAPKAGGASKGRTLGFGALEGLEEREVLR